jgi:hypothetical protein
MMGSGADAVEFDVVLMLAVFAAPAFGAAGASAAPV